MVKLIKSFIRYEGFGYIAERKCHREPDGTISLVASLEVNLIPFAMDIEHKEFVIFRIVRDKRPSLFLWVYIGDKPENEKPLVFEKTRITAVNDLMMYTKWTTEPMDVSGNYPDDAICKAINRIQELSDEDMIKMLEAAHKRINETGGLQRWIREEESLLEAVNEEKKNQNGIMYMY